MVVEKEGGSDQGQAGYASEIEKAWDEIESKGTEESPQEAPLSDDKPRDEKGRFVAKGDASADGSADDPGAGQGEGEGDGSAPAVEPSPITAPEHWSQADKDAFNALPAEVRPLYMEKVKSLESGWNKKFEEVATERKSYEPLKEFRDIFDQNEMQQIHMAGLTPAAYVRRLKATFQQMQANPRGTLEMLARQYGVEFGKPEGAEQIDDGFGDPRARAEIAALKNQLSYFQQSQEQAKEQAERQAFEREWQGFLIAKDQSGNALYPKAEDLRGRIGAEIGVNPEQPGETTRDALIRAYEAVKWTDPDIRKSLLEAQAKAETAERQRKADLEKAKKAGTPAPKAKTAPGENVRSPKATLKDELEAVWDQVNA